MTKKCDLNLWVVFVDLIKEFDSIGIPQRSIKVIFIMIVKSISK